MINYLDFKFWKNMMSFKRWQHRQVYFFSGIRRRAAYHCIKIGEKKKRRHKMPKYKTGSTPPPNSHQHTQRNTKTQKPSYKNNHSRQRKTTKKHYKKPLTTIANSNQTSKSSVHHRLTRVKRFVSRFASKLCN